jgi:hypothetical protein
MVVSLLPSQRVDDRSYSMSKQAALSDHVTPGQQIGRSEDKSREIAETVKPVRRLRLPAERPSADNPEVEPRRQGQRLLEARIKKYRTASDAARQLGIAGPTYLAHENGTRQMRPDITAFYARHFGVSADWILYGSTSGQRAVSPDSAARAPRKLPIEEPGLGHLLEKLNVRWFANGTFGRGDRSAIGELPRIQATQGYLPELAPVTPGDPTECLVRIRDNASDVLAVRDILRVPTGITESGRLFAVRVASNALLAEASEGQRFFVDPDNLDVTDEGEIYVLRSATGGGPLIPALIRTTGDTEQREVYRSRGRPRLESWSELTVIGRVVMQLRAFGRGDIANVAESVAMVEA